MAAKALNFKLDETKIFDLKKIASVFHMTVTDVITQAIDEYTNKMKNEPFYRLTANVEAASKEETTEILDAIDNLTEEDLQIDVVKTVNVG